MSQPATREELHAVRDGINQRLDDLRDDLREVVEAMKVLPAYETRLRSLDKTVNDQAESIKGMVHRRDVALGLSVLVVGGSAIGGIYWMITHMRVG